MLKQITILALGVTLIGCQVPQDGDKGNTGKGSGVKASPPEAATAPTPTAAAPVPTPTATTPAPSTGLLPGLDGTYKQTSIQCGTTSSVPTNPVYLDISGNYMYTRAKTSVCGTLLVTTNHYELAIDSITFQTHNLDSYSYPDSSYCHAPVVQDISRDYNWNNSNYSWDGTYLILISTSACNVGGSHQKIYYKKQ